MIVKELEMINSMDYIMVQLNRVEGKPGMLFDSGRIYLRNYHHNIGSIVKQDWR